MNIDFTKAIRVPFEQRDDLPTKSGVYVVRQGDLVLYIGMAQDIRNRWKQHHKTADVEQHDNVEICCFLMPVDQATETEALWIEQEQPLLNTAGVPGRKQKRARRDPHLSTESIGHSTPLHEHPDFIPCQLGDNLTPEQEVALLPGIDGLLREIAQGVRSTLSQRNTDKDDPAKQD